MTMLCTLIRGQMSYTFFSWGAHVLQCQLLGGQMSSYAIFHRGHMSGGGGGGGGGKCPTLTVNTYTCRYGHAPRIPRLVEQVFHKLPDPETVLIGVARGLVPDP